MKKGEHLAQVVTGSEKSLSEVEDMSKTQMDSAIGSAKKISENLYETTMDGKTIRFAASFGDEVPEKIGTSTVLEEFDRSVVDDLVSVPISGWQKRAYESGVGYYDDDLLMMETFGSGTRFIRNRGMSSAYSGRSLALTTIASQVKDAGSLPKDSVVKMVATNSKGEVRRIIRYKADDLWDSVYTTKKGVNEAGWIRKHGASPIPQRTDKIGNIIEGREGFPNPEGLVSKYLESLGNSESIDDIYIKTLNTKGEIRFVHWKVERKKREIFVNFFHADILRFPPKGAKIINL